MRRLRARGPILLLAVLLVGAGVAAAVLLGRGNSTGNAAARFESIFQDDDHLVYSRPGTVVRTVDELVALGVDRLRITVLWRAVAPNAGLRSPPAGFDPSNPAEYKPAAWAPYDRIVRLAAARGLGVYFTLTAPGPLWAAAPGPPSARVADHYAPSPVAFAQFVAAVGRRYDGSYVPPGQSQPLPRVSYWSVWNEPNQPGWLSPQWRGLAGRSVAESPVLYRAYADAAFAALARTGHRPGSDTLLIGELAPEGRETTAPLSPMPPLVFLRALYCVGADYRPLRGAAASALGCPVSGDPARFAAEHPGLFQITGFAHHPYEFFLAPTVPLSDPNYVPLANLSRLERALDATLAAYGVSRRLPIYLTEYGYETDPPNPFRGVSPRLQSRYLNEAQYLAWSDPRVRALSQFQLFDSAPNRHYRPGTIRYWSTFQTGLLYEDGRHKPALNSYRLPIVIPQPTFARGEAVYIWGMLRAARHHVPQQAEVQWRPVGGAYRTVARITVSDPAEFIQARVRLPGSGAVRIAWGAIRSRAVGVIER